jgi:hypothetical protein
MIGPSASFYDPDQHQQWGSYQQFDFAYGPPAPAAYDQLSAQLYSHQQQVQQQPQAQQPQQAQHVRYPAYPPAQSISDPNPNIHHNDSEDGFGFSGGGDAGISIGIGGLGVRSKGARL